VPIEDQTGRVFAAVAVHGPMQRLTLKTGLKYLPLLRDAAREMAATMSHS